MMHIKAKTRPSQNSCSDQKQCSIAKHAKHFAAGKIPKNRMAFIFLKWKQFGINRTLETFELAGHPINQKSRDFSRSDPVVVLTEILCGDERTFRRTLITAVLQWYWVYGPDGRQKEVPHIRLWEKRFLTWGNQVLSSPESDKSEWPENGQYRLLQLAKMFNLPRGSPPRLMIYSTNSL